MDPTEDLSARVLLRHILITEPPRTPITRSASKAQGSSPTRRSSRLGNKNAGAQTPQDILRRSLKHKMRESITRKSLPATKKRTTSSVLRKSNTPATTPMLLDDGDTPRHILMNILRTEPARSPVLHKTAEAEEPQLSSANASITSKRPSIELSGLDLPDLTIGNAASTAKVLSRKRPRRSLNVTAFEKRLKGGDDVEQESEESIQEQSSLSLSSSTSLSLKTPFADVQTEKRGLQRRVANRRKITEDEFGAAVNKRQLGGMSSSVAQGPSETAYSEGFTLGLSKLSEPDVTTDIVHCNTALYAQSDAMSSNFSIVATQDKPTVIASQLQRQMIEAEQEEPMEMEQGKLAKEGSLYLFPTEEGVVAEPQVDECFSPSQSEDHGTADDSQKEEWKTTADGQSKEEEGTAERDDKAKSEEENRVEAEREEVVADSQNEERDIFSGPEEDATDRSHPEEELVSPDPQTEEEGGIDSQPEEDAREQSQPEEEVVTPDSQTEEEEGAVNSQAKELSAVDSQSEEENDAEYQSDQENPAEGGRSDSPAEDENELEEEDGEQATEQLERNMEHISRRARSEVMPVIEAGGNLTDTTETGWMDGKTRAHATFDVHSSLEVGGHESGQPHIGIPDLAESSTRRQTDASLTATEANKENSCRPSAGDSEHLSNDSPEEAVALDPAEQEEEWEDENDGEESEEVPSKTPAFVREKRIFSHISPVASPSVLNVQASGAGENEPAPKTKQVRKRTRTVKREGGGLPKTYLMNVFKHFAKTKVSADVYPVLKEIMDKFFERLAEDLETYAVHAKRKTIEVEDAELLLKRQGYVNDKVPVEVLIEKYLRMDQRKLLIPIATSGNVVIPKKR